MKPNMTTVLLIAAFGLFSTTGFAGPDAKAKADQKLEILPGLSAKATIEQLQQVAQERPLSARQCFDLSLAYFVNQQFAEALTVARLGVGMTTVNDEKAALYGLVSQANGALGNYEAAAQTALTGQRLNPQSRELAALRMGYFKLLGDEAQVQAAKDHLKRIDPNAAEPVMSFVDGCMIVAQVIIIVCKTAKELWPYLDAWLKSAKQTFPAR